MKTHTYRINGQGGTVTRQISLRDAVVIHCAECLGFDAGRDENCTSPLCGLFPYSPYGLGHRGGTRRLLSVPGSKGIPEGQFATTDPSPLSESGGGE